MKTLLKKFLLKVIKRNKPKQESIEYNFDKNNPLGDGGERVDFKFDNNFDISNLDMYQINHYKRYEFAFEQIEKESICGDFACGTGYGSAILSKKAKEVIGIDLNKKVIDEISIRYNSLENITFRNLNLLQLDYKNYFDNIISFETIEHFKEEDIYTLLKLYFEALKPNGYLYFSVPYMQEESENAKKLGFHLTFEISDDKISKWLTETGFILEKKYYQNYKTHTILETLEDKEFIICIARKNV
ncbi:class I SAM-dependent methyltransferase [Empedobacter falsenii]|uniref:class I SAM-dependent methyltransferase n=1 Tax=Empedobacter falsenii TaxID=343874 RepID=UPI002578D450|nr:class I SAM-dependent methyltransferase [Empedobacter falsenii]MDM1062269.1 class I SAM-dependent methyltransferase [Empedobacter falsenii]